MGFAVVDVKEEGAAWCEDPVGFPKAGFEEAQVVVMVIRVAAAADDFGPGSVPPG